MKNHFISISTCLVLTIGAAAQPVINMVDMTPVFGESFTELQTVYTDPGPSGANQVWDFSELQSTEGSETMILDPANVSGSNVFPDATHVLNLMGTDVNFYISVENDSYNVVGYDQIGVISSYENPRTIYAFPLTMGSQFSDEYRVIANFGDDDTEVETGNVTTIVDAFGTLILPSGTFTSVLRLKRESNGYMYSVNDGVESDSISISETSYLYLQAGTHVPLLAFTSNTFEDVTFNYAQMYDGEPVGIEERNILNAFNLYPSPSSTNVNVDFELLQDSKITFSMLSLDGRMLLKTSSSQHSIGKNHVNLDLPQVSAGIYLLQLETENGIFTHRIAIQ